MFTIYCCNFSYDNFSKRNALVTKLCSHDHISNINWVTNFCYWCVINREFDASKFSSKIGYFKEASSCMTDISKNAIMFIWNNLKRINSSQNNPKMCIRSKFYLHFLIQWNLLAFSENWWCQQKSRSKSLSSKFYHCGICTTGFKVGKGNLKLDTMFFRKNSHEFCFSYDK